MITFKTDTLGEMTLLKVAGSVQSDDNVPFANRLTELRKAKPRRVIFDASELEYINSRAVGDLMLFYQSLRAAGGELALADLRPMVEKVVRAIGLGELLSIYPSVEDAERAWSEQA